MDDDSGEFGEQGCSSAPAVCCWSLFGPRTCGWDLLFLVGGGGFLKRTFKFSFTMFDRFCFVVASFPVSF